MFLAGIHFLSNNGCPIKTFGHDLSLCFAKVEDNFLSVPNTIEIKQIDSNSMKHLLQK